jgi:hypothetical protein
MVKVLIGSNVSSVTPEASAFGAHLAALPVGTTEGTSLEVRILRVQVSSASDSRTPEWWSGTIRARLRRRTWTNWYP